MWLQAALQNMAGGSLGTPGMFLDMYKILLVCDVTTFIILGLYIIIMNSESAWYKHKLPRIFHGLVF